MKKKNYEKLLFIVSFFLLTIYGIIISYNYRIEENYNLLFDSDTARVVGDATEIIANHYRINVHPLFVIIIQPLVYLLKGIVINKSLAIVILSAFTSALSILFIYKILSMINKDNKINLLLSGIYLFSFSNIIFTSGIEVYNFASLFLIILWYYFINKQNKKYDFYSYIILVVLGVFSGAFTITNIIVFLIILFLLWINKKLDTKKVFIIGLATLIAIVGLSACQKAIWRRTPLIWKTGVIGEANSYSSYSLNKTKIKNVLVYDYYNSIISSNIKMHIKYGSKYNIDNYIIKFDNMSTINFILISAFYISLSLLLLRNYKKNKNINRGLLLALAFNTILHLIYGNDAPFLYSLHFIYIIIILYGVNLLSEEDVKWKNIITVFLGIFFFIEFINNNIIFMKVLNYLNEILNRNYILAYFGRFKTIIIEILLIIVISIIVKLFIKTISLIKNEKINEKKIVLSIFLVSLLVIIELAFIGLEAANLIIKDVKGNNFGEVSAPSKISYLSTEFKEYFKDDINYLDEYNEELLEFKSEYETVPSININWSYYYYFGMANRRKLLFIENKIMDIESKEILYEFNVDEVLVIPNKYLVILKTVNNNFIRIYEDCNGVHLEKNGKDKIISGTDKYINLYSFDNYKYKNMLKTTYGELLFNIKDSVIYPNIIVYNKPWYRDAALTSMVLERTNNTDLIKEWVSNITEIYDRQNAGIEEPDNLGELLYIISTQEERNEELINRIEEEANRLADSNEKGYYIYGKTDFGDMHLYQNLWYKLGIERVGREYKFDLESIPEDGYTKMAWWSDYETTDNYYESSQEFPYLTYAMRHKLGVGKISINNSLYPMSVEIGASQAKYDNYQDIDQTMVNMHASPLHSWAAAELILLLMDNN